MMEGVWIDLLNFPRGADSMGEVPAEEEGAQEGDEVEEGAEDRGEGGSGK